MKKVFLCVALLAFLSSLTFAQRGRAVGGVGPTARVPGMSTIGPSAGTMPNSVSSTHGVSPVAVPSGTSSRTVNPNATDAPTAKTVSPDADPVKTAPSTVPDRVMMPDATGVSNHSGVNPNQ